MPDDNKQFVLVEEAATILRVHANTIYRAIKLGEIPHHRIGNQYRIPRSFFTEGLRLNSSSPSSSPDRQMTESEKELFNSTDDDYLKLAL